MTEIVIDNHSKTYIVSKYSKIYSNMSVSHSTSRVTACQVKISSENRATRKEVVITEYDSRRRKIDGNITVSMPADGKCPFCDWTCKSKKGSTFAMHLSRKHTTELGRAIAPYKCSDCDKRFVARTHLNHHIANHHEVILRNCPDKDCQYQGKNKQSVVSHYMRHHMNDVVKRCEGADMCISCERTESVSLYHMGICHPSSPFYSSKKTSTL